MRRLWGEKNHKVGFSRYGIDVISDLACLPKVKEEEKI